MWTRTFSLFWMCATALSVCVYGQQNPQADRPLYVIQSDDILEIFVWKDEDLTRKVQVRPDGRISLPLVQDLVAAGSTPSELKERIEERLKQYMESPNVTVMVDQIQHYRVYVTGKVQNPGSFTSTQPLSVLQALSIAGGFSEYADKGDIRVVQSITLPDGSKEFAVRPFQYDDVVKGKKIGQNILLRSGDVVVVP